jgi:hypothetical protein
VIPDSGRSANVAVSDHTRSDPALDAALIVEAVEDDDVDVDVDDVVVVVVVFVEGRD